MSYLLVLGVLLSPPFERMNRRSFSNDELYSAICERRAPTLDYGRIGTSVAAAQREYLWSILEDEGEFECWESTAAVIAVAESVERLDRILVFVDNPRPTAHGNEQILTAARLIRGLAELAEFGSRKGLDTSRTTRFLKAAADESYWIDGSHPLVEQSSRVTRTYNRESAARLLAQSARRALSVLAYYTEHRSQSKTPAKPDRPVQAP